MVKWKIAMVSFGIISYVEWNYTNVYVQHLGFDCGIVECLSELTFYRV